MRGLIIWLAALCSIGAGSAVAAVDVLDQPVNLRSEADLVRAVTLTIQHAIATSERYRGPAPRVQKFARSEIRLRAGHLRKLGAAARPGRQLAIVPSSERSYLQTMQRNHTRLIELIEHGMGLPLSKPTRRLMETLLHSAIAELALLSQLEKA